MIDYARAQEYYGFSEDGWRPRMQEEPEHEPRKKPRQVARPVPKPEPEPQLAPLIAVVGGSGGVGRTTVALLMAALAGRQGVDTVLMEGDLQFGDLGFWLGLDDTLPTLGDPKRCLPIKCPQGFDLYKAPLFPEVAEDVEEELVASMKRIRANRGLVIADTGSYWSGFTASLLLQCDLFLMVVDQRPASVAAAVKASELCARMGVPSTRMLVVYNRWSSKNAITAKDVARALGTDQVCCIADGKEEVEETLRTGDVNELAEANNAALQGAKAVLQAALPRIGCRAPAEGQKRRSSFK